MEKAEINFEKIQILIEKLKTQVSDHSLKDHLLPTAQMLVAELQQASIIPGRSGASVSVVMPSLAGTYQSLERQQEPEALRAITTEVKQDIAAQRFVLQPPVTITEQAPEKVLDSNSYTPGANRLAQPSEENTGHQQVLPETPIAAASNTDQNEKSTAQTGPLTEGTTEQTSAEPASDSVPQMEADTASLEPAQPAQVSQQMMGQKRENEPEEKQLYELENEEDQKDLDFPVSSTAPVFPTSIPADSPQIQAPASASFGHEQHQAAHPQPPDPGFHAPLQNEEQESMPVYGENPINTDNPDYPQKPEEDKKRQLEFIHENFSAWSDYGIINEAPTLVQNHPLVHNDDAGQSSPTEGQKNNLQKDLNEHFREDREEWGHTLQSTPIENLNNAIGINDRYLFISELFRGDESMYERSIVTLNKFHDFNQAHAWSERELRLKLGWDIDNLITQQFEQLVKRRFMNKG